MARAFEILPTSGGGREYAGGSTHEWEGWAVFQDDKLVYGPVIGRSACEQWIERQIEIDNRESARLDRMEARSNQRDGIA